LIQIHSEQLYGQKLLPDYIIPPICEDIDDLIWKDDFAHILGTPVWNHPSLGFMQSSYDWLVAPSEGNPDVRRDLILQDALFWARDAAELKQVKRVSIFTTLMNDSKTKTDKRETYGICGLSAEFVAGYGAARSVGLAGKLNGDPWLESRHPLRGPQAVGLDAQVGCGDGAGDFRVDLEIDGPGGEVITEVSIAEWTLGRVELLKVRKSCRPTTCLSGRHRTNNSKFRTNWNRIAGCYLDVDDEEKENSWLTFRAPPGKVLVGLLARFGNGAGLNMAGKRVRSHRIRL
jgi:hypothetical protein